jgi:hypothetical protein
MRVKPEQASKVTTRMPTLRPFGEGCTSGEVIDTRTRSIRRGSGRGKVIRGDFANLSEKEIDELLAAEFRG